MDLGDFYADLAAFADSEDDVAVDPDGTFVLTRGGSEMGGRALMSEDGNYMIEINSERISYRRFMTHTLGRLDVFAERLVSRRQPIPAFIDGPVLTRRPGESQSAELATVALRRECSETPPFAARVAFITADAGHGKTALLREHQFAQAQSFLQGRASYLFWHVDLQGRQLLRLTEALMGDIGDLRLTGLWMQGIIRLMRMRALVLAIDGFDELTAEQGGTDAVGALASLLAQLEGQGVVVAAARRTFFDTNDYLRRTRLLTRAVTSPCEFDEITLMPWARDEGVRFLEKVTARDGRGFDDPEATYNEISDALGDDDGHPMITRPFLLAQVARALLTYRTTAADFVRGAENPHRGVEAVVEAFVKREVEQKWVYSDTGEPYLTVDQHMQLLADIAEEMYRSQKDRLDLDVVETIATLLVDDWGIEPTRRHQVLEMVRMHVLLVAPLEAGSEHQRCFDHPEFRDYFIAQALKKHVQTTMAGGGAARLVSYLAVAQISDSVARYVCNMVERTRESVQRLLAGLEAAISREWKATFLQSNAGTLLAAAVDGLPAGEPKIEFVGRAVISSLSLEHTSLNGVSLSGCMFVNASLQSAQWADVTLVECNMGHLVVDDAARFDDVLFLQCEIDSIRINRDLDYEQEFAPDRIRSSLLLRGIHLDEPADESGRVAGEVSASLTDSAHVALLRRVLRLYARTTVVSDRFFEVKFRDDRKTVMNDIVPLLEKYGVLTKKTWRGSGIAHVWGLSMRLDDVLAAEGSTDGSGIAEMWSEAKAR